MAAPPSSPMIETAESRAEAGALVTGIVGVTFLACFGYYWQRSARVRRRPPPPPMAEIVSEDTHAKDDDMGAPELPGICELLGSHARASRRLTTAEVHSYIVSDRAQSSSRPSTVSSASAGATSTRMSLSNPMALRRANYSDAYATLGKGPVEIEGGVELSIDLMPPPPPPKPEESPPTTPPPPPMSGADAEVQKVGEAPMHAPVQSLVPPRPPPDAPTTLPAPAADEEWFYMGFDDAKHGPVSAEQLRSLRASGDLLPLTYVWTRRQGEWLPLEQSLFE